MDEHALTHLHTQFTAGIIRSQEVVKQSVALNLVMTLEFLQVSQTVRQKGKLDMDKSRDKLHLAGHKGTFKTNYESGKVHELKQ